MINEDQPFAIALILSVISGFLFYWIAYGITSIILSFLRVVTRAVVWVSHGFVDIIGFASVKTTTLIKRNLVSKNAPHFKPALISIVLLIIASLSFGELPRGYYMLLRIVVCFSAAFIAYLSFKSGGNWLPWCWVVIAIVFNPVLQIHLDDPEMWQGIDILCVCFFVHSIFAKTYKEVSDK
ncbi:MAG TPA: hypothetical protein ENH94_00550 [Phycisphaerales bacterium]|nr:hypothetical protein [Phycisphaerales bacterium]